MYLLIWWHEFQNLKDKESTFGLSYFIFQWCLFLLLVRNKIFIIIAVCSSILNINFTKNLSQNSKEDEFDTWSECFKMIYKDVCFENRKCAVLTDINKLTEKCTIKLLKSFVYTPKFLAFVRSAFSAFMSRPILESHVQFYQPFCTKHKCAGLQCLV